MTGPFAAVRQPQTLQPSPNSEPVGALTGAPVHTIFRSTPVIPASAVGTKGNEATLIVPPTAPNRVVTLLAPFVPFRIYIGGSGVSPQNGFALPVGQPYVAELPGLQGLYAVTDAPVYLTVQVQIALILFAERQRIVG
jgi:hypothetical protein